MEYIVIGTAVALAIVTCLISWQVWLSRGRSPSLVIFVLRGSATSLLLYLSWVVLFDYDVTTSKPDDVDAPRKLVVLQDNSHSMTFPAGVKTRDEVAQEIWQRIESLAATRSYVETSKLVFATNFVEADRVNLLRTDSTNTAKALSGVLSRYRTDAIILISDGAATGANPPDYMLKWAENRGVGIYAIGVGDATDNLCDINVSKADCQEKNPDTIRVEVTGLGKVPDLTMVRLSIDGERVATRRIMIKGATTFSFSVPAVDEGWHEFEVEAISPENEVCQVNNRRMGVFRKVAPQKVLFLYSSPQMEYRHLTRFLDDLYPGRIQALSVFSTTAKSLAVEDYIFCIMGNVTRSRLSGELLAAIDSGSLPTLFLAGTHLGSWSGVNEPFPLARTLQHRNLFAEMGRTGRIVRATGLSHNEWRASDFDSLPVYDLLESKPNTGSITFLEGALGDQRYPLLVADQKATPSKFVILTNSSWRWSLSPDSKTRSSFRALWRRIAAMAIKVNRTNKPLKLTAPQAQFDTTKVSVGIHHETPALTDELTQVTLTTRQGETLTATKAFLLNDMWTADGKVADERPSITWMKGTATLHSQPVESEDTPRVLNPDGLEFSDTLPHPERLQALVQDPKRDYADAANADLVIKRALDRLKQEPVEQHIRHRDWARELTIALIVLLVFSIEWFYERRLKEQST